MPVTHLRSPWIEHVGRVRPVTRLQRNLRTDVAIVGAGIAGVSTAYFLLKHTWKRIALLEGDRVAHGATGHNAGQLVSYFERALTDIANEFGHELAAEGQREVEHAWELLDAMRADLQLETPMSVFTGHAGCVDREEIMLHIRDNDLRQRAGLPLESLMISASYLAQHPIAPKYRKLYTVVGHQDILTALHTKDRRYIAALSSKKGCMNSARFCEEAVSAILKRYPRRFILAERSPVSTVRLHRSSGELVIGKHTVLARRIVLCTNGFERFRIENHAGANIDVKFHHLVRGSVGYMAAFTEAPPAPPMAASYLPAHETDNAFEADPYFYVTRRPHTATHDLLCIGGPEALMDDTNNYSKSHPYPEEAKRMIDRFLRKTYKRDGRTLRYTHLWHGLMGYTPNGIRCVGAEPCNPVLLYNLGCNGVGILPSIMGGRRIATIVKGKRIPPSIFDPADQRCIIPETSMKEHVIASPKWFSQRAAWGFVAFWILATFTILAAYWARVFGWLPDVITLPV